MVPTDRAFAAHFTALQQSAARVCGILHNKIIRGFKKCSISNALSSKKNSALRGKWGSVADHCHHVTYSRCNMQNKCLLAAQMNLFPTNYTTKFTYPYMGDYFNMFQLFLIAILWEHARTHARTHTHTWSVCGV
jgi:hypothetical protein